MAMAVLNLKLAFSMTFVLLFGGAFTDNRPPQRRQALMHHIIHHFTSPQQVHISIAGENKMRISWITSIETPSVVNYGTTPGVYQYSAHGKSSTYGFSLYRSGHIHNVVTGSLEPNTIYYYRCGPFSDEEFSFKTPPPQLPIKFAVVGDLGQTRWTNSTLEHVAESNYDVLILPGDLSYADALQPLWDSFGRLVEPLASQRPWMVTEGNHEVEMIPLIHPDPFTAYNARWRMPYEQSGSTSNLYYSFDVSGVHVVMLGSYTDFDQNSEQYKWLEQDLKKVDRKKSAWIVVVVHAPWYNSNTAHQGEPESDDMKKAMEELLYKARVDVVIAGHVHAYERFTRVYNGKANRCGAAYITVGTGGNREGLASEFIDPKPKISVFREANYGHGQLEVKNASHALWSWYRTENDQPIASDSIWLRSLSSDPCCKLY